MEYKDRQMVIQVSFLHPEMLSLDATDKDYIGVRLLSSDFFRDMTGQQLSDETVLLYPIDRQLTIEDAEELKRLEESFESVLDAFSWTTFVV